MQWAKPGGHGEELSERTKVIKDEFTLPQHNVEMHFVTQHDATSLQAILSPHAAEKWSHVEQMNPLETRGTIQKSLEKQRKKKTVLDLTIVRAKHETIGRCSVVRDPEMVNEFDLMLWIKKDRSSSGLHKDIVTALVGWARENLKGKDYTLVYPVEEDTKSSEALVEAKGLRPIRTYIDEETGKKMTDYRVRLG